MKRLIATIAVLGLMTAGSGQSRADFTVPSGFGASTLDLGNSLGGISLGPGGASGTDLYVGGSGAIYRVDPGLSGFSTFATGVGTGTLRPDGLRFDPGTLGTGDLYLSRDDGSVLRVSSAGSVSTFSSGGTLFSSNDLEFARTGTPFGDRLFVSNGPFGFGNVSAVDAAGSNSVFAPTASFSDVPIGLAFARAGGAFGGDLFSGLGNGAIVRVDSLGNVTPFTTIAGLPDGLAFSPGGAFGDNLYVSDLTNNRLLQVGPSGVVSVFATGFGFGDGVDTKLAFAPDGNTLFLTNNTQVVRIAAGAVPEPSSLTMMGLAAAGLLLVWWRRRKAGPPRPPATPNAGPSLTDESCRA